MDEEKGKECGRVNVNFQELIAWNTCRGAAVYQSG
jgi:hypothetical protein